MAKNRGPFRLFKFRTMIDNAEKVTGPMWAKKDDPRITPIGKFFRKTRIDELPQFFNVLGGDMSFIGPRPIRKFFADKLSKEFPYYFLRFYVKPGLTGWAQVSGDYGDTVEGQLKKLEYELFYIHEYSLLLDGVIFLKTVQRVLGAKGQ
jgi:lipopolysaccharide/colanic/teichoic acid biosynthesis glycosyltransferase